MKKTTSFIISSFVTVTMMVTIFAKEYIDQTHIEAEAEARRKLSQEINENFEKGKTDDFALKKAIISLCEIIVLDTNFDPFVYVIEDMARMGILRERQIQGLENIIHEMLSAIEKDEKIEDPFEVLFFLNILKTIPNYNLLPIIKESMKSKNEIIRNEAHEYYNGIMGKKQNQPKLNEMKQLIYKTPFLHTLKTSSRKPFLWIVVFTLFAIIGGAVIWRKKT